MQAPSEAFLARPGPLFVPIVLWNPEYPPLPGPINPVVASLESGFLLQWILLNSPGAGGVTAMPFESVRTGPCDRLLRACLGDISFNLFKQLNCSIHTVNLLGPAAVS